MAQNPKPTTIALGGADAEREWTEARVPEVRVQHVKGNDVEQFKDPKVEVVLYPPALKDGNDIYPYANARN